MSYQKRPSVQAFFYSIEENIPIKDKTIQACGFYLGRLDAVSLAPLTSVKVRRNNARSFPLATRRVLKDPKRILDAPAIRLCNHMLTTGRGLNANVPGDHFTKFCRP